jgi:hypothetical protein
MIPAVFWNGLRVALAFGLALGTAAPVLYTVKNLGVLPGASSSRGGSINEAGQVAGTSEDCAFRYTDGLGMEAWACYRPEPSISIALATPSTTLDS